MGDKSDIIDIMADGKKIGSFEYSKRKSHKHLFNLAGIELYNSNTGQRVDRRRLYAESMEEEA